MKYFCIVLITLLNFSCNGQNRTESLDQKESTIKYGSGDVVTKGYLDNSGNIWFATSREGVFKYDGEIFTNYTVEDGLCGNEVWAILEDKDGFMWFGTGNGLCKYDGKTFETIPIPNNNIKSDWLEQSYPIVNPNAVVSLIQDKSGAYWIGSNGAGVYKYDGIEFTSHLKERGKLMPDSLHHNVVLSIAEDDKGDIWFTSFSHGGISQYSQGIFTHHSLKDGYGDGMTSSIYLDKKRNLWVGTRNGGIYKYDGKTFLNVADSNKDNQIFMASFLEDSKGTLWVSSYAREGLYQYNGTSFVPFEVKNSDKLIDVKCISEDKDGNIWFGGRNGLLWRYDGEILEDYTQLKRR